MQGAPQVIAWPPGEGPRRVSPPAGAYFDPCVHPDGSRVVYWGGALGTVGVWQTDLASGKPFRLTSMASGSWHPAYAPAGDAIVFVSDRFGAARAEGMEDVASAPGLLGMAADVEANVFVMRLDGRGVRQVTAGPYYDRRPVLAPDGSRVAFASDRGGSPGLWLADAKGGVEPEPLVEALPVEDLCWAADGSGVYFAYRARDGFALGVADPAAGGWEPLRVDAPSGARAPFACPDGRALLLDAPVSGGRAIVEAPTDGSPSRTLAVPGFASAGRPSRSRIGVLVFESPQPRKEAE